MKKNDLVRLTKLRAVEGGEWNTPAKEFFSYRGEHEGTPIDFFVEGYLNHDVVVGEIAYVYRTGMSNEKGELVRVGGYFHTTRIQKIEGDLLFTKNSVYKIEVKELKDKNDTQKL